MHITSKICLRDKTNKRSKNETPEEITFKPYG